MYLFLFFLGFTVSSLVVICYSIIAFIFFSFIELKHLNISNKNSLNLDILN